MVLGRPKKQPITKPRRAVVPTEPPLFAELERRGLVVVLSESGSAPGGSAGRTKRTKPRSR